RLAAQLRATGIRRVTGLIVGDETFFDTHRVAPGWKYRFYMDESPPLSALSVDRGRYQGRVDRSPAYAAATSFAAVLRGAGIAAAGVPMAGVRIVDGSGLSRLDRLTANALVGILRASWDSEDVRPTLVAALPVAGKNGTLEDRLRRGPAYGVVRAKTGTTNQASALSGYVRGKYVFAVLQNGRPLSYWWARVAQDRFVTALAAPR